MEDNYNNYINILKKELNTVKEVVFLCIGTDRVIGDCVGPITGSLLKIKYNEENIYGDMENNLTFENIRSTINQIETKYNNPYVVAIDSALSTESNIGKIFVDFDGINFGEGLEKNKCKIGNIGIKVVVGKDYNDNELNFRALQNTSLREIIRLSKKTFDGINYAYKFD